jgi:2-polyprenyl-3-methyl-5-hydroxy-6-metoxy-1,4-benzoquinol methylase
MCNQCTLQYVSPRLNDNEGLRLYNESFLTENVATIDTRFRECARFLESMRRVLPYLTVGDEQLTVYDLGTRGGAFVYLAKYIFGNATGFDLPSEVEALKRLDYSYINIKTFDELEDYPCADLISCLHVLEHIHDPKKFLREFIMSKLKPDGIALIEVPNWGCMEAQKNLADWYWYQPAFHVMQFTRSSLVRLLKSVGLSVIETYEENNSLLSTDGIGGGLLLKLLAKRLGTRFLNVLGIRRYDDKISHLWKVSGPVLGAIVEKSCKNRIVQHDSQCGFENNTGA